MLIIELKANSAKLNLPTGTDIGNKANNDEITLVLVLKAAGQDGGQL